MPGMRNWLIVLFFYSFALHADLVAADVVNVDDPRIHWVGQWTDQGDHKFAASQGASLSFSFQGTAVSYNTQLSARGALTSFWVDNDAPQTLDSGENTPPGVNSVPSTLFSKQGLDPSQTHTFNAAWAGKGSVGGIYMEVFSIDFTPSDTSNPQPNPNPVTSPSPTPQNNPPPSIATIATKQTVTANNGGVTTIIQNTGGTPGGTGSVEYITVTPTGGGSPVVITESGSSTGGGITHSGLTTQSSLPAAIATGTGAVSDTNGGSSGSNGTVGGASKSRSNAAVIGGAVGGVLILLIILLLCFLYLKRRRGAIFRRQNDAVTPFPESRPSTNLASRFAYSGRRSLGGRSTNKVPIPIPRGLDLTARRNVQRESVIEERRSEESLRSLVGPSSIPPSSSMPSSSSEKGSFAENPTPVASTSHHPISSVLSIYPTQRGTMHRRGISQRGLAEESELGHGGVVEMSSLQSPVVDHGHHTSHGWDAYSASAISDPPPQYEPR